MSYFEKIGNTISAKSKEIAKKAKDASETNSLNNVIRAEQNKIDTNYKMIGKLYFEKYGDSLSEEFSAPVDAVKASQKKIAETRDQIIKIKSRNCCPNCNTSFKTGSVFCSKCGTKVKEDKPVFEENKCVNCGNTLNQDDVFCDVCGTNICAKAPSLDLTMESTTEPPLQKSDEKVDEEAVKEKTAEIIEEKVVEIVEDKAAEITEEKVVEIVEDKAAEITEEKVGEIIEEKVADSQKPMDLGKVCSSCGEKSEDLMAKFCNRCGSDI